MTGKETKRIDFPPFRLDYADQRLFRDDVVVPLRPKSFDVLRYLAQHPGKLITKDELLDAVWPDTTVTDTVLKVSIREIREALKDDPGAPRFIETSHRRGYRFIAEIKQPDHHDEPPFPRPENEQARLEGHYIRTRATDVVGREPEIARLQSVVERALQGERQIVFVTGEPGIGKTTLVDAFLERALEAHDVLITRGQCLEQYGSSEAYLPMLEAVTRLCRGRFARAKELFHLLAPTLVAQIPSLNRDHEDQALQALGSTRECLLREMAEAFEAICFAKPLVLVIEDLHWSDFSTLDLVCYLARRSEPARLMVIGTYRPAESTRHPLNDVKRELQAHRLCQELSLKFLDQAAVAQYVSARFPGNRFPPSFAQLIHQRTDGNPLFIINLLDFFVAGALIAKQGDEWYLTQAIEHLKTGMPDNVRQMIEKQIDNLDKEEQQILEAASVAGVEFSTGTVSAALRLDILQVEEVCERLARRHLILSPVLSGQPSDEEFAASHTFIHALYQNVLYERTPPAKRAHLHRRIGEHMEVAFGARGPDMAAELAMHFERAKEYGKAVRYLQQAAEKAQHRFAHHATVELARRGLRLVERLGDSAAHSEQELLLQTQFAVALAATHGYGFEEVETAYSRARALCQQSGSTSQLFPVLWGIWRFYLIRSDLKVARELAQRLLDLAQTAQDPALLVESHLAAGVTFDNIGDFESARTHLEQGASLYDPAQIDTHLFLYGHDPRVVVRCFNAWALWSLGFSELALETIREAFALAEQLRHPETQCFARFFSAWIHQLRRESEETLEYAEAAIELAGKYGFAQWGAFGSSLRGWALSELGRVEEGITQMRQTLDIYRAIGSEISRPHFLALLAEALMATGELKEALQAVDEGVSVADATGQRYYEAELHHLKGRLMLALAGKDQARACFRQAIELAQSQKARSFELRAATSLASIST
jgi:DNA-binding winged helix-turn-helix (wHTH) protein/predicted ATPase